MLKCTSDNILNIKQKFNPNKQPEGRIYKNFNNGTIIETIKVATERKTNHPQSTVLYN